MANHKSAKKRIRRNENRSVINGNRESRIRTFIKKVESALLSKDADGAMAALRAAQPEIHRGVAKGVMPKERASRKISRLNARIKSLKEAS